MIAALLPYTKWTLEVKYGKVATSQVPKWFKPAARIRAADAYWDPKEECVRNKSDEMLNQALSDTDGLYWEIETAKAIPTKHKKIKVDNESVTDSLSTVKTAIRSIRTQRTAMTTTQNAAKTSTATKANTLDTQTTTSQVSTISQLTEQVSILQLAHNKINSKLDKLAKFIMAQSPTTRPHPCQKEKLSEASKEVLAKHHDDNPQLAECPVPTLMAKHYTKKRTPHSQIHPRLG